MLTTVFQLFLPIGPSTARTRITLAQTLQIGALSQTIHRHWPQITAHPRTIHPAPANIRPPSPIATFSLNQAINPRALLPAKDRDPDRRHPRTCLQIRGAAPARPFTHTARETSPIGRCETLTVDGRIHGHSATNNDGVATERSGRNAPRAAVAVWAARQCRETAGQHSSYLPMGRCAPLWEVSKRSQLGGVVSVRGRLAEDGRAAAKTRRRAWPALRSQTTTPA